MTSSARRDLDTPIDGLLASSGSRVPYQANVLVRSFLLERPAGNVLVYNSPGITDAAAAIRARGGATRLLINHAHEAMYGPPELDVPVSVHERDRADTARSLAVAETFDGRTLIDDDLEVIPTPGHTPGTASYLWDNGTHRFLFTGDFLWIENGAWKAVVLDDTLRSTYLDSLRLVCELDVDVLVPWGTTDEGLSFARTDPTDTRARIDEIVDRLQAGGNR
ncbi:MAG: beta-lactamase domain protein [Frondihabitans sp.]|nr:beta-lactamase domain protein [Frondihabitans sp.]